MADLKDIGDVKPIAPKVDFMSDGTEYILSRFTGSNEYHFIGRHKGQITSNTITLETFLTEKLVVDKFISEKVVIKEITEEKSDDEIKEIYDEKLSQLSETEITRIKLAVLTVSEKVDLK